MWHAVHDGYLGNAPPGRLQVYWFLDQPCQQHWPNIFYPREKISRHENQTDPDVSFGWCERKGFTALMPKPTCCAWIRTPLPKSFVATGSSTPVPSGNGGEEICISVSATAHVQSSPQSNWWSATTSRLAVVIGPAKSRLLESLW